MLKRIKKVTDVNLPWLVIEENDSLVGYAYATPWKARSAYRFSVEATVYLSPTQQGKGLGTLLYQALFSALKQQSIHAIMGGITLPNPASIALHEKLGMTKVAHFQQVGFKFDQWLDTGYWQLTLN
jgi:phosphinothricin acetyltransferase